MYNIVLDKQSDRYERFLMSTDFRIGMSIHSLLGNPDLDEQDKMLACYELLYGSAVVELICMSGSEEYQQIALHGLVWFMTCGKRYNPGDAADTEYIEYDEVDKETGETDELKGKIAVDFEYDGEWLESSFMDKYGIKLSETKMHWFEFMALFNGLKDTAYNEIMYYRTVDTSKLPKQSRIEVQKLQRKYKVRKVSAARKEMLIATFGSEWKEHI